MKTPPMTKRQMSTLATKLDRQREELTKTVDALLQAGATIYAKPERKAKPPTAHDSESWIKEWQPPREGTMMHQCILLFQKHYDEGGRPAVIDAMLREIPRFTRAGANTYYHNLYMLRKHKKI